MQPKLNSESYSVDFEISKRYIEFSSELLRISLLLLSGFGAIFLKGDLKSFPVEIKWAIAGIILLLMTICSALFHRYFATDALSYWIAFLRKNDLNEKRGMISCLKKSNHALIITEILFGLGLIVCMISILLPQLL